MMGEYSEDVATGARFKWKLFFKADGEVHVMCPVCYKTYVHDGPEKLDLRDWHYCRRCGTRLEGIV